MLQHENRHFCIVELHARQLRKKLSQLPSLEESNAKEVVHQAYRSAVDSCKAMEESYNLTTSYGRLMQEEAAWQQRLSQRLAEMEVWSSPRVVIALE